MLFFPPTITPKMQMNVKYEIGVLSQVPGPQTKLFAFSAAECGAAMRVRFNTNVLVSGLVTLDVISQICCIYRRICNLADYAT